MKLSCIKKNSAFYKKTVRLRGDFYGMESKFDLNKINSINNFSNQSFNVSNTPSNMENNNYEKFQNTISADKECNYFSNKNQSKEEEADIKLSENNEGETQEIEVSRFNSFKIPIGACISDLKNNYQSPDEESEDIANKDSDCVEKKKDKKKSNKNNKKDEDPKFLVTKAIEKYNNELIKKSIDYAWVHVSCALWNPQVQFNDFDNKEEIKSKYFKINILI